MHSSDEQPAQFAAADMVGLPAVSAAALSPDGNMLVCVVTRVLNDEYKDDIVLIDPDTLEQRKIAAGSSPQWSPDGKSIAFMGDGTEAAALFVYEIASEKFTKLADVYTSDYFIDHYALCNFCWSPDGAFIAYVSAFGRAQTSGQVTEINDLLYKTKGGRGRARYAGNKKTHIWLVALENKQTTCLFDSAFNEHSIAFSPDGKKICFVSDTSGETGNNQCSDIYTVAIDSGEVRQISAEKGAAFQPVWSPDGSYIGYLGVLAEVSTNDSVLADTQVYLIASSGSAATCLTSALNRRIEQLSWSPDAQQLYFTAGNHGDTLLYRVNIHSGQIEKVIAQKGKLTEYALGRDGKNMAYIHTDSSHPGELFIYDTERGTQKQLTYLSEPLLKKYNPQPAESFWYNSFDAAPMQGWLIKPANFESAARYPLILVIHGGPHNMFGDEFEERMQWLAANGYGVLFINPRGSSGYGQQMSAGTLQAWGEGDYEDLMAGVSAAIQRHSWIDDSRLGVTGQSYGGYMTNRIITKTNRFKAAVADGSICNLVSFAGTSLYHSLMESEFQKPTYDNFEMLWQCSPLKDVKQVSTPVLFLHGETDYEVPVGQAEEMYIALKKRGVPATLVIYADEGHGWRPDLRPSNRVDVLERMVGWFNQYVR